MKTVFALFALIFISATSEQIHTLYNSLDPKSIPEHLAFYQLYPSHPDGKRSLEHAWTLLTHGSDKPQNAKLIAQLSPAVDTLVSLITKDPSTETPTLSNEELWVIESAGQHLANRQLRGYLAATEEQVLALPSDQIDLARGLFLSEGAANGRSYEAIIDLMALQILSKLPPNATNKQKIQAINTFIFEDMQFRFPPHSLYSEDIDLYTFLPAVLDSRRGVCLGVSILYLCIAQRIDLPLEIVTPPGHIYIRCEGCNIETTARGIHIDSDEYLSIETRSLQERTLKEVIGMAHFNNASRYWNKKEHDKVQNSYRKALAYMPDDMLLKELMGYNAAILNDPEGKKLLQQVQHYLPDYAVSRETMAEDYLNGNVDAEGMQIVFLHVDETMASIQSKQEKIQTYLKKYPKFRSGIFALATTWLQLHRLGEAIALLEDYHKLDQNNPTVEYYLSILHMMRMNYKSAWKHYEAVERITAARNHHPKALKELKQALHQLSPR